MSGQSPDLYLTLRQRLDEVKQWVPIDPAIITNAMETQNLSFERAAARIPCSEKTLRRYVKRGAVPRDMLLSVGKALELEIGHIEPTGTITVDVDVITDLRDLIASRFDSVDRQLARLELEMGELRARAGSET